MYNFSQSANLGEFSPKENAYDISICMETLEHLPIHELEAYIRRLYNSTKKLCFVTVPNEKGFMLLIKYFTKKYILKEVSEKYTSMELLNGFLGKTKMIARNEGGHKGFDYSELITLLEKYFHTEEINGIPSNMFTKQLSFTIGIVLRKKKR